MKKYYLIAIELGNDIAMQNLGKYYQFIEKDYDKMKKYYLMAIELGNNEAEDKLIRYYRTNKEIIYYS
jgi:TPR repeat protein